MKIYYERVVFMESYKELAVNYLQLIVAGEIDEAYESYVSPDLRHHKRLE